MSAVTNSPGMSRESVDQGDDHGSTAARAILIRIFSQVPFGFAVRLWNGTRIHLGPTGEPFTLVFRSRETFRRLVLRPNTLRFALAFTDGDLDVEGDLFTALHLANRIEALRLRLRDRVAILAALAKV
jgi:hypothetical protein